MGLEPEPGVNRGFFYAQWLSLPTGGGFRAGGPGAGALRVLGFSCMGCHSQPWFGVWLGPEGLGLHFCAGFTFSLVCVLFPSLS